MAVGIREEWQVYEFSVITNYFLIRWKGGGPNSFQLITTLLANKLSHVGLYIFNRKQTERSTERKIDHSSFWMLEKAEQATPITCFSVLQWIIYLLLAFGDYVFMALGRQVFKDMTHWDLYTGTNWFLDHCQRNGSGSLLFPSWFAQRSLDRQGGQSPYQIYWMAWRRWLE